MVVYTRFLIHIVLCWALIGCWIHSAEAAPAKTKKNTKGNSLGPKPLTRKQPKPRGKPNPGDESKPGKDADKEKEALKKQLADVKKSLAKLQKEAEGLKKRVKGKNEHEELTKKNHQCQCIEFLIKHEGGKEAGAKKYNKAFCEKPLIAFRKTRPEDIKTFKNSHLQVCRRELFRLAYSSSKSGQSLKLSGDTLTRIASDLLQVLGQIVVDRATRAAWDFVRDSLRDLLKCNKTDKNKVTNKEYKVTVFPAVCSTLQSLDLKQVLKEPKVLLHAAVNDFFSLLSKKGLESSNPTWKQISVLFSKIVKEAKVQVLLSKILDIWKSQGPEGVSQVILVHINQYMEQNVSKLCSEIPSNEGSLFKKAAWIAAKCIVEGKLKNSEATIPTAILQCNVQEKLKMCVGNEPKTGFTEKLERLVSILVSILGTKTSSVAANPSLKYKPMFQLIFFLVRNAIGNVCTKPGTTPPTLLCNKQGEWQRLIDGIERSWLGLMERNWSQVGSGMGHVFSSVAQIVSFEAKGHQRFFRIMAAAAQYAQTYEEEVTGTDKEKEAKQKELQMVRKDILNSLIDTMVNRSERTRGVIFSIGGSFGFSPGIRLGSRNPLLQEGSIGLSPNSPFSLPIGLALQTFGEKNFGFHLQLGLVDLGQYVSFQNNSFEVATPQPQDALNLSLTIGFWIGRRQIPFVAGLHVGISPFAFEQGSNPWFVGLFLGMYVPFFDF